MGIMEDAANYLQVGIRASSSEGVSPDNVAATFGSATLDVYATPAMVALMESAAVRAIGDALPEGWTTVGIAVDVRHLAPTPVGGRVSADAELQEISGRRLVFSVTARDEHEEIGRGRHERYCVDRADFLQRAEGKVADA